MEPDRLSAVLREIAGLPEFKGETNPGIAMRSSTGDTPLHVAAHRGDTNAVRVLLDAGADPNAADERGDTPLHKALRQEHVQVARMLVAAGSSLDAVNCEGVSARAMTAAMPLWESEN